MIKNYVSNLKLYGGKKAVLLHFYYKAAYRFGMMRSYNDINWDNVSRLVFVCRGNICRSPYAEMMAKNNKINTISCGLSGKKGKPANPDAIKNAYYRGVDLSNHRANNILDIEIEKGDLFIGMEPVHLTEIRKYLNNDANQQISLLGLWSRNTRPYLHDPYGLNDDAFQLCYSVIDEAIDMIKSKLDSKKY